MSATQSFLRIAAVIPAAFLLGCGKHSSTEPAPAASPARPAGSVESLIAKDSTPSPPPASSVAPVPADSSGGAAVPAVDPATSAPDIERLNRALTLFISSRHRFPKDIPELCREEELYPPVPPAGKHLVLDANAKRIVVADGP